MPIKVVLFDAAGVLFPVNRVVGAALAQHFSLTEEQLLPMWQNLYIRYGAGELTTDEFLRAFAAMYNLPSTKDIQRIFTESFVRSLTPMPGMGDVLEQLRKTDVTIAMLSDTSELFAHARRKSPFSKYFDKIFLSFEIGYRKPDPRAYQVVTDHYKVDPTEVFFVDDNYRNTDAALALGMQVNTFTNAKDLTAALKAAGIL